MKILALDTSSKVACVAILDENNLLGEYYINHKKNHSENLVPMIESILEDLDITVDDIDYFAASIGPGSFTGLRIGITTVKGMAFATNKKTVAVDTLDGLASNVGYTQRLVCPIIDAKNGQVYTAIYDNGKRIISDTAMSIEELTKKLKFLGSKIIFVGDGVLAHKDYLKDKLKDNCVIARQIDVFPRASSVAHVALQKIKNNEVLDCEELMANYLRKSQAEREYEKKHNIQE